MKSLGVFIFFFLFPLCLNSQIKNKLPIDSLGFRLGSAYQNEDIFTTIGVIKETQKGWLFHVDFSLGLRRTFAQQTPFKWITIGAEYDVLKNDSWFFGPSTQLSYGSFHAVDRKDTHRYTGGQLGYNLSYGRKLRVYQGSYMGVRSLFLPGISKGHIYPGFSIQLGLQYAW